MESNVFNGRIESAVLSVAGNLHAEEGRKEQTNKHR